MLAKSSNTNTAGGVSAACASTRREDQRYREGISENDECGVAA